MITLNLTDEEVKLLESILMSTSITGNMVTLTKTLTTMSDILKKLEEAGRTTPPSQL
jgi:hypothetical protein